MKSGKNEQTQRHLLLLKLDAKNVLERISERRQAAMEVFALRRTREHFPVIFHTRYDSATFSELAHCSAETILALDQFYNLVNDMRWYLFHTEDMPSTAEDTVYRMTKRLEKLHATLDLFLDAELSLDDGESHEEEISHE
jgi:hypothetical protein